MLKGRQEVTLEYSVWSLIKSPWDCPQKILLEDLLDRRQLKNGDPNETPFRISSEGDLQ